MSSKDKEKTLHDRLKQFFRLNKGGTGTIKGRIDISLTREIELEIGPESPIHHRIKVIRELSDAVLHNHLEEHAIEKLWGLTEDLLREDVAREHRHTAFQFFCSLAQGQADKLGMMRVQFFRLITSHSLTDDIGPRLELLRALTDNGKDILYIEEQVAPFLLSWMPAVTSANKTQDLLSLLVNLVKYNAAYVEDSVIAGLIQNTCFLCSWSQQEEVVLASLALLDVVVCYAQVPPETLSTVISMLCVNVGNKNFSTNCWKIMRKLLGTHLGHSALLHMCRLLQSESSSVPTTAPMLRGAVFHVSMGMWGGQRVTSLHTTAAAVLPAFVQALRRSRSELVAYEVVLCVRRLVTQSPQALTDPAWDCVLAILEEAVAQAHSALATELHGAISDVEAQYEKGEFRGDVPRFFRLIESCSTARPELSVLRLLNHLAVEITPTMPEWLTRLRSLLDQYFWQDTRTNVRVKALDVLSVAVHSHRALYEDELVECVLSLQLQDAIRDKDTAVRNAVVQLLVSLALETESKRCLELLDLIEKFLNHPFEVHELEGSVVISEAEALDVKSAALGLIKIFQSKTYQLPSSHAIRAYRALVSHLEAHYHQPKVFEKCNATRFLIFKCFLQIRADSLYHIGMPETLSLQEEETSSPPSSPLRFSSYLAVDHRHGERPSSAQPAPTPAVVPQTGSASPPQSQQLVPPTVRPTEKVATLQAQTGSASPPQQQPVQPAAPPPLPAPVVTHLSLQHACKAVIVCLNKEKDWRVLSLVLRELPRVLQNKALVLARHGNDVEYLAAALCAMVSEKSHIDNLRNAPPKFSRSDYQALVLASLGPLASYPLEPALQQKLVKCLQVGLASRCAGACVSALTLCTLEMRDTMYKLLPEVLLNLSKISATVLVAIPILEFLSTLTRLPKVFASFVGDQYMSVFAIALPYTNPFKYNHYTVSLAHHVIAVWFLKCRLPFRRDFVKFIITGLKANVLVPFEEGKKPELVNEDSSSRKRSSSLTEQGSRRREQLAAARLEVKQQPAGVDEELLTFHTELTETCIDLMARHTFSSCAALPRRLGSAEWLLSGGLSMTWLLGHKLLTVTTSGCSQKAIRGGLCDKCLTTCRLPSDKIQAPVTAPISPIQLHNIEPELELTPSRRRHKSATHRSVSSEVTPITPRTKDDLHMGSTRTTEPVEGFFSQQTERGVECSCWCQGWAEILVRRATGNMSWVMRLQNPPYLHASSPIAPDFPMSDISTLYLPSLAGEIQSGPASSSPEIKVPPAADPLTTLPVDFSSPPTQTPTPVAAANTAVARPTSEAVPVPGSSSSLDQENSDVSEDEDSESRRRNPVRRSNSSPEMSGRPLKSPLNPLPSGGKTDQEPPLSSSHEEKKLAPKQPPTRVSCEAIPEEMGGTTPPTAPVMTTLQSSVSYPGPTKPTLAPTRSAPPPQQPTPAPVAAVEKRGDASISSPSQQPETRPDPSALPPLAFRDRGHTISVMSPVRKPDWGALRRQAAAAGGPSSPRGAKEPPRSGVHPSFVFLQLYHDGQLGSVSASERPVLVPPSEMVTLALRTLDYIPPYETHKLGVLYVGPGQAGNEAAILQNAAGSVRYTEFLQGLGSLVRLRDVDSATTFLGGLDTSGNDGKFAYIWQDAMTQVIFHTATLMPTKETDPSCSNKKRHIGNDYVTIVFNESGEDYNVQCIKGQFNFACVVVTPLGHGTNQVSVKAKDVLAKHLGTCSEEPRVISDHSLPTLVRQLALHANLASMIVKMTHSRYASNWLERLRQIKRLRARVCTGDTAAGGEGAANRGVASGVQRQVPMDDFTEYTHYK